jgi:O-antigen/teichoic acid export membrane protein
VFHGVNALMSNAFYAMDRVIVPALVMPIGTIAYIALAPFFSARLGVLGLTASLSVAVGVVFMIMMVMLSRRVREFSGSRTAWNIARYVALSALSFGLSSASFRALGLPGAAEAAASLAAGASLYLLGLLVMRDSTLTFVYRYLRKAVPSRQPAGGAAG